MIFEDFISQLLGRKKLIVSENQRIIVSRDGKIADILGAGKHHVRSKDTEFEPHDINVTGVFNSKLANALVKAAPELADRHLLRLQTAPSALKIIYRDGVVMKVMEPDSELNLWRDAGPFEIEDVVVDGATKIPSKLAQRLKRAGLTNFVTYAEVSEGYVGLLFVDGALKAKLTAGQHAFWNTDAKIHVSLVDLRLKAHEVTGQEILTKDRVSLRVNISAQYQISDPEKAVTLVQNYSEALHRSLQFAFRKTLGALTLDELLSEKVSVDAAAAEKVRKEMAKIGVSVGEISLKDVILPGEMRDILNQVVAAQKEAEANVIRRREETNATRSLLNTAKVMAENPVMLRLKELEAIETIAGKVDQLTILNGTEGLMSDLVKLTPKT